MAAKKKAKPAAAKKASKPAPKAKKPAKVVAKAAPLAKAAVSVASKAPASKAAALKPATQKLAKAVGVAVKSNGAAKAGATAKVAVTAKSAGVDKKGYRPTEDSSLEERELGAEPLDEETEVETVEEEVEDTEGPPPWWKDDPTGIEGGADEAGASKSFDDSDEWTEDDEDWSTRRGTLDELEGGSDEDERW
jgi:hypothetical protein